MTRIFKSNKIVSSLIIILCIFFVINPKICSNSCLNAISVWAFNILPVMFPFFILTRLIVEMSSFKPNFADKFFCKAYNSPVGSLSIFLLSALSGYPMGAKLICSMYEQGKINSAQAKKMLSFCSVSGPMFMIGTVGIGILKSYKAGLVILIANILGGLINGLVHRGKKIESKTFDYASPKKENLLSDIVYDSLISILMVGGFIVLSFIIIDALKSLHVLSFISNTISWVSFKQLNVDVVQSILSGIFEMTRGIIDINTTNISLQAKTIIASGMIGFGGISIMMQSLSFIKQLNMKFSHMLFQKVTQCIITLLLTIILVFIAF